MNKGTSKHFNGIGRNKLCEAGVCYDSVKGAKAFGFPCIKVYGAGGPREHKNDGWADTCDKYEEPSDKEVADFEAMEDAYPVITSRHVEAFIQEVRTLNSASMT